MSHPGIFFLFLLKNGCTVSAYPTSKYANHFRMDWCSGVVEAVDHAGLHVLACKALSMRPKVVLDTYSGSSTVLFLPFFPGVCQSSALVPFKPTNVPSLLRVRGVDTYTVP